MFKYLLIILLTISITCTSQIDSKRIYNKLNSTQQPVFIQEDFELKPENAHPKAIKLLKDSFYWDIVDEFGPFGNDDGNSAFNGLVSWRKHNSKLPIFNYLESLITRWDFPKFDLKTLDTITINTYINDTLYYTLYNESSNIQMKDMIKQMAKESDKEFNDSLFNVIFSSANKSMGYSYLLGLDNAVIAIAFGQFVLEGKVDNDILDLGKLAIKRELLPILLNNWDEKNKKDRLIKLQKMYLSLSKIN